MEPQAAAPETAVPAPMAEAAPVAIPEVAAAAPAVEVMPVESAIPTPVEMPSPALVQPEGAHRQLENPGTTFEPTPEAALPAVAPESTPLMETPAQIPAQPEVTNDPLPTSIEMPAEQPPAAAEDAGEVAVAAEVSQPEPVVASPMELPQPTAVQPVAESQTRTIPVTVVSNPSEAMPSPVTTEAATPTSFSAPQPGAPEVIAQPDTSPDSHLPLAA